MPPPCGQVGPFDSANSPACDDEWVHGVCHKPRIKCADCPSQAFTAVTDRVLVDHLQGRHVVGVYPLLENETCWFLAVDFDKDGWGEDVTAFRETCKRSSVPPAVERSRSGNGAHAWFFFASPITASTARQMGGYLLESGPQGTRPNRRWQAQAQWPTRRGHAAEPREEGRRR